MNEFPWGICIGLGVILCFTISFIVYILLLDKLEANQSNVRVQDQENNQNH